MSRRKNDFFDDLATQIFATVGDRSLTGADKSTALEFLKISLKLAHNAGIRDGLDEARRIVAPGLSQEPERKQAAE